MRRYGRSVALTVLLLAAGRGWGTGVEPRPEIGPERAILHTAAGDIVLAFYAKAAPKTVAQILKLMRAGAYDTTHFFRVEPGFVIQLSVAQDRLTPLKPDQAALIQPVPLEISPGIRHHAGVLSMARQPNDPNSGETSFSILLGDAPHLDGQYTVFGEVEQGQGTIDQLLKVRRDSGNHPAVRLTVKRVEVVDTPQALAKRVTPGNHPIADPGAAEVKNEALRGAIAGGVALMLAIALAGFFLGSRIPPREQRALHLLVAFVGAFLLLVLVSPAAQTTPLAAGLLFCGIFGLFKILGRFESA
jgi:cyclophilin family peptidyl-prolyl cis-trans isomerase